jgi:hypothetical protein
MYPPGFTPERNSSGGTMMKCDLCPATVYLSLGSHYFPEWWDLVREKHYAHCCTKMVMIRAR